MAEPARAADLAGLVLRASSTFGLRLSRAERVVAGRRSLEVETAYGRVRVKLKELGGEVVDAFPEYEDCRRAAAASGVDTGRVMREAAAEARRRLGLA
jgi:uncharacterized protein (DUF111 family)